MRVSEEVYEADSCDLIEFARAWVGLGWAVQEQVVGIMRDGDKYDANPTAVEIAIDRLGHLNREVDEALSSWQEIWRSKP